MTRGVFYLLDVRLDLEAPDPIFNDFCRVYGRFQAPCTCSMCGGLFKVRKEISVSPATGDRYMVTGTWESSVLPEEDLLTYLLYLVQNHAVRSSSGFYTIHGACLEIRGKGCILSAASCVGKTTLTFELVRRGARFLSDEIAAVPVQGAGVHAFPRALGLRPGSIEVLGAGDVVRAGFSMDRGEVKNFLDMGKVFPHERPAFTGLDYIIFLSPPLEKNVPEDAGYDYLEISLPFVPEGFVDALQTIEDVDRVIVLSDRSAATLRLAHARGSLIVQAVDEAACTSGAYLSGHHRGKSLPPDYSVAPVRKEMAASDGIKRLTANTLNFRCIATSGAVAAAVARFAGQFGGVRFLEIVPGDLGLTADVIEEECGGGNDKR